MEEPGQQETSKYNEAALQIQRLNELWLKAEKFCSRGLFIRWKFTLDSIWRELYSDIMRMNDKENIISKDNILKIKISEAKTKSLIYSSLNERHEQLKFLQDASGKGGVYVDPESGDID